MSFLDDIEAFREKALTAASDNTNKVVDTLFTQTVARSPTVGYGDYSQGVMIANWYVTSGNDYSTETSTSADPSGAASVSRIDGALAEDLFYGRDNILSMSNSSPGVYRAEILGWPSGDNETGWRWTGTVGPYAMISTAVQFTLNEYT